MLYEVRITQENIDSFRYLIPQMYEENILKGRFFSTAVYDGEIDKQRLVGVVVFKVSYQWQEIIWLALTSSYNQPVYGADILRMRIQDAKILGNLLGTYCEFPDDELFLTDYFLEAGFEVEKTTGHSYQLAVSDINKYEPDILKEDEIHCFTFESITTRQKQQLEEDIKSSKVPLPTEIPIDWSRYNDSISCCYEKDGRVVAAYFAVDYDENIAINGIYSSNNEASEALIPYLIERIQENARDDELVIVPIFSKITVNRFGKIRIAKHTDLIRAVYLFDNYRRIEVKDGSKKLLKEADEYRLGLFSALKSKADQVTDHDKRERINYDGSARAGEAIYSECWDIIDKAARDRGLPINLILLREIIEDAHEIYKSGEIPLDNQGLKCLLYPVSSVKIREDAAKALAAYIAQKDDIFEEVKIDDSLSLEEKANIIVDQKTQKAETKLLACLLGQKTDDIEKRLREYRHLYVGRRRIVCEEMVKLALGEKKQEKKEGKTLEEERARLDSLINEINLDIKTLTGLPEFKGKEYEIQSLYEERLSTYNYYVDCIDRYQDFLEHNTELDPMRGAYLRTRLGIEDVPVPSNDIPLEDQNEFDFAPWELDDANNILAFERKMTAPDPGMTTEELREQMMRILDENRNLFTMVNIVNLFDDLPQLVRAFAVAKEFRKRAGEEDHKLACAMYNTLLLRQKAVITAGKLTIKKLTEIRGDFSMSSLAYWMSGV